MQKKINSIMSIPLRKICRRSNTIRRRKTRNCMDAEGVKVLSKTPISQAKGQGGITVKAVNSFQLKENGFQPALYLPDTRSAFDFR